MQESKITDFKLGVQDLDLRYVVYWHIPIHIFAGYCYSILDNVGIKGAVH